MNENDENFVKFDEKIEQSTKFYNEKMWNTFNVFEKTKNGLVG
jgi:hypothetical protein